MSISWECSLEANVKGACQSENMGENRRYKERDREKKREIESIVMYVGWPIHQGYYPATMQLAYSKRR